MAEPTIEEIEESFIKEAGEAMRVAFDRDKVFDIAQQELLASLMQVRFLHRQESILISEQDLLKKNKEIQDKQVGILDEMKKDSKWIKRLTVALVFLTLVLGYFAWRLDGVAHELKTVAAELKAVQPAK